MAIKYSELSDATKWDVLSTDDFIQKSEVTETELTLTGNILTYVNENNISTDLDLSLYLDDSNLARLVSGTVNSSGIATFTRDDATTFTVDMSVLLDGTVVNKTSIDALGIDAATVNNKTVETSVPAGAVFTDNAGFNTSTRSIAIGDEVLTSETGERNNIAIGNSVGWSNSGNGSLNVLIGYQAFNGLSGGSSNVVIGNGAYQNATSSLSGSVAIGKQAGQNETASNKLHIANNSAESLIEGDFSARTLNVNGDLTAESFIGDGSGLTNLPAGFDPNIDRSNISIGNYALPESTSYRINNIAIGEYSMCNVNIEGSSNVAVGSCSLSETSTGWGNVAVGHQSLSALCGDSPMNVAIGYQSGNKLTLSCNNTVLGAEALTIATTGNQNTAIGRAALAAGNGSGNVALGHCAGFNETGSSKLHIANNSAESLIEGDFSARTLNVNGDLTAESFIGDGSGLTNLPSSGFDPNIAGNSIAIGTNALINDDGTANCNIAIGTLSSTCTTNGSHNVAVGSIAGYGVNGSNNVAIGQRVLFSQSTGNINVGIGLCALNALTTGGSNIAIGGNAGSKMTTAYGSIAIGLFSSVCNLSGHYNTAVGSYSLGKATSSCNTAIGFRASCNLTTGSFNTAIGICSLMNFQDTSAHCNSTNATGIGYNAAVSGDNQVQLGNSSTTTYVYGTVQNRSDIRDKACVRDTCLGLNFIRCIRPVDYKWDMRIDYQEEVEIENPDYDPEDEISEEFITKIVQNEKDGSKIRNRYHQGVIAQEIKQVLDDLGAEFGGYQDHSISGGNDILSIGYDEFIAPLIKAVQELDERIKVLESSNT